jgi:hypothetical protein
MAEIATSIELLSRFGKSILVIDLYITFNTQLD